MGHTGRERPAMKRRAYRILLAAVLALPVLPAGADRLHLETGAVVDTPQWWIDGDDILYRSSAGTIGIPRSMVVRVERTAAAPVPTPSPAPPGRAAIERENERIEQTRELIEAGSAALAAGDCESASGPFFHAMTLEPKAYAARVQYVLCEIRLDQDASALSAVLDGLVLHPDGAELHELLGDLKDRDENMTDALRSWRRAFSIQPNDRLRAKIEKGERDLNSRRGYEFARTSHFNLRYDGNIDEALAAEVAEHLEDRFWELTRTYDYTPRQPITTLLYPNQAFREVTQSAEWVGGVYDGKIRVPLGGLKHLHRGARRVLTHELTHAVVHLKSRQRCPRWLQEGLAQVSDGTRLTPADETEVRRRLSELAEPWQWEKQGFSYPLALSLVRWLERRRDFTHLVWVLDLLGEGRSVDAALAQVYGEGYEGLCRRWSAEVAARSGE